MNRLCTNQQDTEQSEEPLISDTPHSWCRFAAHLDKCLSGGRNCRRAGRARKLVMQQHEHNSHALPVNGLSLTLL
jgi:hypothetical protein